MITLGVDDLARARSFYADGLGFPVGSEDENILFLQLEGTWLTLYPRDKLADDVGVSPVGSGFQGFTLAHNVGSKEEVDRVLLHASQAGATIIKPAQDVFWGGYSGYFSDHDGYYWEVTWNPYTDLT